DGYNLNTVLKRLEAATSRLEDVLVYQQFDNKPEGTQASQSQQASAAATQPSAPQPPVVSPNTRSTSSAGLTASNANSPNSQMHRESGNSQLIMSIPPLYPELITTTMDELMSKGYKTNLKLKSETQAAALYSAKKMGKSNFLHIHLGSEACYITPVIKKQLVLEDCKRINWAGKHAIEYLQDLLVLKYPTFPQPVTQLEVQQMFQNNCYVAENYKQELQKFNNIDELAKFERIIQMTTPEQPEVDQSQIDKINERHQLAAKRRQKLLRANYDARQRMKQEKLLKEEAEMKAQKEEENWRQTDLKGWSQSKRERLQEVTDLIKERETLRNDSKLRFRQSLEIVEGTGKRKETEDEAVARLVETKE
ncbi:hypothetical protein FF38_12246, partial [Lucilia cuprina]